MIFPLKSVNTIYCLFLGVRMGCQKSLSFLVKGKFCFLQLRILVVSEGKL